MKTQLNIHRMVGQPDFLIRRIGFLFLLLIAFSKFSMAESRDSSALEIRIWNNQAFEVLIDNQIYRGQQFVRIDELQPGRYSIRVRQRLQNGYGQGGGGVRTLYEGRIDIPARRRLSASIDRNRRLRIQQSVPYHQRPATQSNCTHSTSCCACNGGIGPAINQPRPVCGTGNELYPAYPVEGNGNDSYYGNGSGYELGNNNHWESSSMAFVNQEFSLLIAQLEDNFFDDQRMIIARQALEQRQISSSQAREILERFNFESTRLEFAKFAYLRVSDPERFYLVNEVFSFSSSVRELNDYINSI